jgi:hypothetical protein
MKFIVEKVNHQSNYNDDDAKSNDIFPSVLIHFAIYKQLPVEEYICAHRFYNSA